MDLHRENTVKRTAILQAAILMVLFSFLTIVISVSWETNDDAAFAHFLSTQGNDYAIFLWRLLSVVIHAFYMIFPSVEWWTVFTCGIIFVSAGVIAYVIHMRYERWTAVLISIAVFALLWYVGLYQMNFTRTAAITVSAGCMLIANSTFANHKKRSRWVEYGIGIFLLLVGASIRRNCAMMALAFLAVTGFIRFIRDGFTCKKEWIKSHLCQIVMLGMAALCFFAANGIHKLVLTPEQEAYAAYNSARSRVQDYSSAHPSYEDAEELYESLDLTPDAVKMLFRWGSEDTEVFSEEILQKIGALKQGGSLRNIAFVFATNGVVILLTLVYLVVLSARSKNNVLLDSLLLGVAAVILLYLSYNGRMRPRVNMSILFMVAGMWVFLSGTEEGWKAHDFSGDTEAGSGKQDIRAIAFILALVLLNGVAVLGVLPAVKTRLVAGTPVANAEAKAVTDQINDDKEHAYIFDMYAQPVGSDSAFGFWEGVPSGYCENRFTLGGWDARHPHKVKILAQYGITNPMRALFEEEKVYSSYSARVLTHLRYYYDETITVSEIGQLGALPLVQYTAFQDHSVAVAAESGVNVVQLRYDDSREVPCWYFSAVSSEVKADSVLYCNLLVDGQWQSYRLRNEGENLWAYFYEIGEDYDFASAEMLIVERMADGKMVFYETNTQTTA